MKKGFVIGIIVVVLIVMGTVIINLNNEEEVHVEGTKDLFNSDGTSVAVPFQEEESNKMIVKSENDDFVLNGESKKTASGSTLIIRMNENGFSPKLLEINLGDTVSYMNVGAEDKWPATDIHPSHQVYPGSSIGKCDTPEEWRIFDACRPIRSGGRYGFTFSERGMWRYHDHLSPGLKGTIIVK